MGAGGLKEIVLSTITERHDEDKVTQYRHLRNSQDSSKHQARAGYEGG